MSEKELHLSTSQAARLIGVHESSVKRWCNAGDLACTLTEGGHRRIPLPWLLAFVRERALDCPLLSLAPREEEACEALLHALTRHDFRGLSDLAYAWLRASEHRLTIQLFRMCREMGCSLTELCDDMLAPILHRVGGDWFAGTLDVGDEHRITEVVVDILYALRNGSVLEAPPEDRVAVIGCDEGNGHELGAQMVRLVLEAAGWRVVYLGGSVPAEDLARQQAAHGAGLVCVSITSPSAPSDAWRLVRRLAVEYRPDVPYRLAVGGSTVRDLASPGRADHPFLDCRFFDSTAGLDDWLRGAPSATS